MSSIQTLIDNANITSIARETIAKELGDLQKTIQTTVREKLHEIIGIKHQYGRWQLANSGDCYISDMIRDILKSCITEYIKPLIVAEFEKMSKSVTFKRNIIDKIISTRIYHTERLVEELVRISAQEFNEIFKKQVTGLIKDKIAKAGEINTDFLDPEAFAGEIGTILFEHHLEHGLPSLQPKQTT